MQRVLSQLSCSDMKNKHYANLTKVEDVAEEAALCTCVFLASGAVIWEGISNARLCGRSREEKRSNRQGDLRVTGGGIHCPLPQGLQH